MSNNESETVVAVKSLRGEVSMDSEQCMLEVRKNDGTVLCLEPELVTDLAGDMLGDTTADVLSALANRLRLNEAILVDRAEEPGRMHVTPMFVREAIFWREIHVRTLRLEPGDTLRQYKYCSQVASVGPKYRSLGVLPADGAHLFTEGQRTMLDGETQRMMLLELVPE